MNDSGFISSSSANRTAPDESADRCGSSGRPLSRVRRGFRVAGLLLLSGAIGCGEGTSEPPTPLTIFSTSSLERFAREAGEAFASRENVAVDVRAAGTHELATELSAAPSADLFLAAGTDWMDRLEDEGRIVPATRWEGVSNRMAVLGRKQGGSTRVRIVEIATLGFRRFVVADPSTEPAGQWARQWLRGVGVRGPSVWEQLEGRREVVADLGEVLRILGEDAEAVGVVFLSDLGVVPGTEALFRSPDLGIRYSFALVDRPGRPPAAARFFEFLKSPEGIEMLQRSGLLVEHEVDGPA